VYESTVQDLDANVSLGATVAAWVAPVLLATWNISPTGWLRGAWLDFILTITGNAAGAFAADGPWSFIQKVTLYDLGGEVIFQVTGYEWMVICKFGGYFNQGDPRASITYTTAPTSTTPFHFMLYLPLEVVKRDALGTVQNESKPGWKIEVYADSAAATVGVGGTAFTAAGVPSVRVRGYLDSYTEPAAEAPNGRPFAPTPPLPGSLQYWKSENLVLAAGAGKYDLVNGIGFPLRNVIYYVQDNGNLTRATADPNWPDPATLLFGSVNVFTRSKNLWIERMSRSFDLSAVGATTPAADTAQGRENGVFPHWLTEDMANAPGAELRMKYLDTQVNSLVRLTGTFGAAVKFFALANWLATPSKNRYALIAGSQG
jgi:hypothetical protein